jgi:hypothetical protein
MNMAKTDNAELLDHLGSTDFADRVAAVAADMRDGADLQPEEVAERLGVPLGWLIHAAAGYAAWASGKPVLVVPTPEGKPH